MKKYIYLISIIVLFTNGYAQSDFEKLSGPYLGQTPPGATPEIFAPGIISTGLSEALIYFTAGGKEVFFSCGFQKPFYSSMLFYSKIENGKWTEPVELPFERLVYHRPVLNPDGTKIIFISSSAEPKKGDKPNSVKIYISDRTENGWTKPKKIEFGDAFPYGVSQTTMASNGNIYFQAGYHIDGDEDIYFSEYKDGKYQIPIRLSDDINSEQHDVHPVIAPDESYLIFDSQREDGFGNNDLYISFKDLNGKWTKATNMGSKVNSKLDQRRSSVSSDGKYLFFESRAADGMSNLPEQPITLKQLKEFYNQADNGYADIYWIGTEVIEELRKQVLK